MVNKQQVLQTLQVLPDTASWTEIADALLELILREGAPTEFVDFYRSQLTPADLKEYEQPRFEVRLDNVIAEMEKTHYSGTAR